MFNELIHLFSDIIFKYCEEPYIYYNLIIHILEFKSEVFLY